MRKYNFYLLFVFVLFFISSSAQEASGTKYSIGIKENRANNMYSYELINKMKKKLAKDFNVIHNSTVTLVPEIEIISEKTIEGMETSLITSANVIIEVKNSMDEKLNWTWEKVFKGKGHNKRGSLKSAVKKFIRKDSGYKAFKEELNLYIDKEFNENCTKYIENATKYFSEKKYKECISKCENIDSNSSCKSNADKLKKEAFDAFQVKECEGLLYKAKLKKRAKNYNGALRYLLRISPDSPCAEGALDLAKKMEDSIGEDIKSIQLIKIITEDGMKAKWLRKSMDNIYE